MERTFTQLIQPSPLHSGPSVITNTLFRGLILHTEVAQTSPCNSSKLRCVRFGLLSSFWVNSVQNHYATPCYLMMLLFNFHHSEKQWPACGERQQPCPQNKLPLFTLYLVFPLMSVPRTSAHRRFYILQLKF